MPNPKNERKGSISFLATLPAKANAITLDGCGDVAVIRLEVPRIDALAVLDIWREWAQKRLWVTVELDDGQV